MGGASRWFEGMASCTECPDPGPRGTLVHLLASELENCLETQDKMKSSLTLSVVQSAVI